ncbi:NADH-FMN oxidoreductase RutF, flavin reductase (DIM6/NTAB) family [Micromonospora matsumotoense]|uniref:NADH-FMN oxidoreductase RutF, flavin reductase (DIM6/NTAB) family n=1 Tax=Micromonospora matsumotoense TaxID=121616 RepID=A0A1C5AWV7_9ACTN|nr:flavin reductase family protein [Micromonospora matsumotoense]SCF49715.1 NADH-FMN oxidoreductase RutF, flavin reductase (DIM6/NTAB) family [Micromonospora matsumotoense]
MSAEDRTVGYRRAVRRIVSGVSVLTVRHGDTLHGTTVSSLSAVSRQPLLVAVCLGRWSTFTGLASAAGRFTVNVLAEHQAGVAAWFADPGRPSGAAQFDHLTWQPDPVTDAPRLDGALASFSCDLHRRIPAGDHDLLLGEVTGGSAGEGNPLLHFSGQMHEGVLHPVTRGSGRATASALAVRS